MSARRLLLPLPTFLLALVSFACEPRIEEPPPPEKKPPREAPVEVASAAPKKRCIHPTEAEPKRKLARKGPDPSCPKDDLEAPPLLATGKIVFPEASGATVTVEVARRNHERMRGLMYRKDMAEDHGMIFVFDKPEVHTFWMRNTCLPLDMLFVDEEGFVVGIEENTTTMSDSKFSVPCASSYVIEVNAGFCRRHGIRAGQKVELSGI